jgi:hypothetical protein
MDREGTYTEKRTANRRVGICSMVRVRTIGSARSTGKWPNECGFVKLVYERIPRMNASGLGKHLRAILATS